MEDFTYSTSTEFTLKVGQYTNVLDFFNKHNLSFLITNPIDFSIVPSNLKGKGYPRNLGDYLTSICVHYQAGVRKKNKI